MPLLSLSQYAVHRGVSPGYITKLKNKGMLSGALVYEEGKKRPLVDSVKADRLLEQALDPGKGGKIPGKISADPGGDEPAAEKQSFLDARTWTERYKAAERKLDFEVKTGKFVLKSLVRDTNFRAARLCRDSLLNIPDRVSAILAAEKDEAKIRAVLTREITDAIKELLRELNAIT